MFQKIGQQHGMPVKITNVTLPQSVPNLPANLVPCLPSSASRHAAILLGSYRKNDAEDPETFTLRVEIEFQKYPEWVIAAVALELPESCKWLPSIMEIHAACEARIRIAAADHRKSQAVLPALPSPEERKGRATYAELKAQYGDDWGLERDPAKPKMQTAEQAQSCLDQTAAMVANGTAPKITLSPYLRRQLGLPES